jgi:excisionase family DNA binding protein
MNFNSKPLLDVKQTCAFLNIKVSHLRALIFKQKIVPCKVGRLVRFKIEDLEKWLEEQKQKGC